MKSTLWFAFSVWALLSGIAGAQTAVIASIQGNGRLAWTNPVNTNARYHVEWAPQATGP